MSSSDSGTRPLHSIHSPVIFSYRGSTWSSIIGHRTIRHLLMLTRSFTLNLFARYIHIQGQHLVINHRPPDYMTIYIIVGLRDPFDTLCPTLQKFTQITGHSNRRPLHSIHSPVIFSYRSSTWSSIIGHQTIRHLLVLT
ncbi:unnamed protein product, partial [Oppiella nova]